MRWRRTVWIVALSALGGTALAKNCPITSKFSQPAKQSHKSVLYNSDVVVFQASFRVDTDGNIRSYSAVDPSADRCGSAAFKDKDPFTSGCAMDTLCNGLVMFGPGQGSRRPSYDSNSCSTLLKTFKRYRASGYTLTDGTGIAGGAIARHTEGPQKGRPCETAEGFLVSEASARSGLPGGSCVQEQYLDSAVPYIAVPKCWSKNYRIKTEQSIAECKGALPQAAAIDVSPGDLAAVQDVHGRGPVVFALVGDLGPNRKLGEASIGLHVALKGRTELPRTVHETNSYDDKTPYNVVIFRDTGKRDRLLTLSNFKAVQMEASEKFASWQQNGIEGTELLMMCGANTAQ